jgi:hypothetical protein
VTTHEFILDRIISARLLRGYQHADDPESILRAVHDGMAMMRTPILQRTEAEAIYRTLVAEAQSYSQRGFIEFSAYKGALKSCESVLARFSRQPKGGLTQEDFDPMRENDLERQVPEGLK